MEDVSDLGCRTPRSINDVYLLSHSWPSLDSPVPLSHAEPDFENQCWSMNDVGLYTIE